MGPAPWPSCSQVCASAGAERREVAQRQEPLLASGLSHGWGGRWKVQHGGLRFSGETRTVLHM